MLIHLAECVVSNLTNAQHAPFAFCRTSFVTLILEWIDLVYRIIKIFQFLSKFLVCKILQFRLKYWNFLFIYLIIGKFTLILKLTRQNWFWWTQIWYCKCLRRRRHNWYEVIIIVLITISTNLFDHSNFSQLFYAIIVS